MTKGSTNYTWTRGRLLASVGNTTFEYDFKGRRTKKGSTEYYYDGDKLIAEVRSDGTLYFFYDESGVCGMRYNNTNYEFIRNIFGDVVAICNEAGGSVAFYSYDAWGNCTIEINQNNIANINPFRYRGYYYDTESGLYYLMSRYYDPSVGQFISPDTQDYLAPDTIGGVDLYAYGLNNPVMYVDPSGHAWETVFDLFSLGISVVEVVVNPASPGSWIGLTGDILDLIPFVTGLGEAIRGVKIFDKATDLADGVYDTVKLQKAVDFADDIDGIDDAFKALDKTNGFTKSTRSAGITIHTAYKANVADGIRKIKEYSKIPGIRLDFLDDTTIKIIYELKPGNIRSVRNGIKQLLKYKKALGKKYKMILELY